jgi:hypothetical protein
MDNAMLGLPSFEVGAKTTSAFLINLTAFTVSNSGSPGPQPTHESFIIINFKIESYLNEKTVFVVLNDIYPQRRHFYPSYGLFFRISMILCQYYREQNNNPSTEYFARTYSYQVQSLRKREICLFFCMVIS